MALMICGECGNEISDQAETCSHCGVPEPVLQRKPKSRKILFSFCLIGLVGYCIIGAAYQEDQKLASSASFSQPAPEDPPYIDEKNPVYAINGAIICPARTIAPIMANPYKSDKEIFLTYLALGGPGGAAAGCRELPQGTELFDTRLISDGVYETNLRRGERFRVTPDVPGSAAWVISVLYLTNKKDYSP